MNTLFPIDKDSELKSIGGGAQIKKISNSERIQLFYHGRLLKEITIKKPFDFRVFIACDVLKLQGVKKSYVANALDISRQSIDTWEELYHKYGISGLQGNTKPVLTGNKARVLEAEHKAKREKKYWKQLEFNFSFNRQDGQQEVEQSELPFEENTDWQPTRYAGMILYQATLNSIWRWYELVVGYLGEQFKIMLVFLFMSANNIRSINQLKNIRNDEAGLILGMDCLPSIPYIWSWFHQACYEHISAPMLTDFSSFQIEGGIVGTDRWFIDGHSLPYTGKEKLHSTYITQRRMPMAGRSNTVTCDSSGNIVDFTIEEGHGDLRTIVKNLDTKWLSHTIESPVKVFDREGYDAKFFWELKKAQTSFVTWLKNVDTEKMKALPDEKFLIEFEFNTKQYAVYEEDKTFEYKDITCSDSKIQPTHKFVLREIRIWNKSSKRRTCAIVYDHKDVLSTQECAKAILSRWGASENTFKHMQTRHPLNYQPGFKMVSSKKQDIENPEIKRKTKEKKKHKLALAKLYKEVSKTVASLTKKGQPRANCKKNRLEQEIEQKEKQVEKLSQEIKEIPERIDVSKLEDYHSFKKIDDEGKYLFDFVTASVWNARNIMIDWLKPYFSSQNEIVDLFYAITKCQGWIKITDAEVRVRLETLQQSGRKAAQIQLCRKLTSLGSQTPSGKYIVIEVGEPPQ